MSDLDAVAATEEVQQAIARQLNVKSEQVEINTMRPTFGDTQKVTTVVEENKAERLLMAKWIVLVAVAEMIRIKRCFKCLKYGHNSRE